MTLTWILASAIITFVPLGGQLWDPSEICGWDTWATYIEGKIWVCNTDDVEFRKSHEIGHYFWDKFMTAEQKAKYEIEYKKAKKLWIRAFYRDYGMWDMEEDFCDNLALYITKENSNPFVMKRIRLIKSFLK